MAVRLLIADSDVEMQTAVRDAALARRLIVFVTASASEAHHLARAEDIDAIVIGAQLVDARPLETVAELADSLPDVVVVMYGNIYGPSGQAAALTAGAHGYFARGIDTPDDIISALVDLPLDEWHRRSAQGE